MSSTFAQATLGRVSIDTEKLRRYFDAGMWPEAIESLRAVAKDDEFNPIVHFAIGEALFRSGAFTEALHEFEVSKRLSSTLWPALQRMADSHLALWKANGTLPDRAAASDAYQQLSSVTASGSEKPLADVDLGFIATDTLTEAKQRAREVLKQLWSPAGIWSTKDGRTYQVSSGPTLWLTALGERPNDNWRLALTTSGDEKLSVYGYMQLRACLLEMSGTGQMKASGTEMEIHVGPTGKASISGLGDQSSRNLRKQNQACIDAAQTLSRISSTALYEFRLARVQDR